MEKIHNYMTAIATDIKKLSKFFTLCLTNAETYKNNNTSLTINIINKIQILQSQKAFSRMRIDSQNF